MINELSKLVDSKTILGYSYNSQIPSTESKTSRLIDRLVIQFNDGTLLKLQSFCSGCLENSNIEIYE